MSACGYKFYLRVFNYISLRYRVEHETRIKFVSTSGHVILFIMYRPIARCCDAIFLLAETEVAMTTVITSQVKDKNCIFTMDTKFSSLEKSWYFIGVYIILISLFVFLLSYIFLSRNTLLRQFGPLQYCMHISLNSGMIVLINLMKTVE